MSDPVWDDRAIQVNLAELNPKIHRALAATIVYHKPRAVAYARLNAPWTDRTSNARNGLFAVTELDVRKGAYRLIIAHGVPYGIWLEVRFAGRYAIIRPTIDHEGPLVMATAQTLIRRVLTS